MRFDENCHVIKRDGQKQEVCFEKIEARIRRLCADLPHVDVAKMAVKTAAGIFTGVQTTELDQLASETAAYHSTEHPDYDKLAVRLSISNLQKQTARHRSFVDTMRLEYNFINPKTKEHAPQISRETLDICEKYETELNNAIVHERDFNYSFFGLRTLQNSYLTKQNGQIIETIQYRLMRKSIGIHGDDLPAILESYDLMSNMMFTHGTPTWFNAGTRFNNMSSCYLSAVDDCISSIYDSLKRCALMSKSAGGIGLSISRIRATGSYIKSTDGHSNGIVPMLKNFNATARYVDQCFVAGTLVRTSNTDYGSYKQIQDIQPGDYVTSHLGNQCKVKELVVHEGVVNPNLLNISTPYGTVTVTEEHTFYAIILPSYLRKLDTMEVDWYGDIIQRLERGILKPEWLTLDQLTPGDLICTPIYNEDSYYEPLESSFNIILNIEKGPTNYTGPLYDLEVEQDESYVTPVGSVHNGGGKRKGAIAVYLEPWHADIKQFLLLKNNNGSDEVRCRDLYYGLWVPDLFYRRVEENGNWSLFCPNEAPGLVDVWGKEFEELYCKYEATPGLAREVLPARNLMALICTAQCETAMPYMLNKDQCNAKSNHQHLGTITNSNLCTEIIEKCDPYQETAVCNLATIALPRFVDPSKRHRFDFESFSKVVHVMVRNLNKIIDRNYYPVEEAKVSNLRHRPIGIGVQGLHDLFLSLGMVYTCKKARNLNKKIFAALYYAALDESCRLAEKYGPHESYAGSPVSKGILQFDMWGVEPDSDFLPWAELKARIAQFGVRNSLLVAPPPTASTSQILGNSESFEPYSSNLYVRSVLSGSFVVVNRFLVDDLSKLGLWDSAMRDQIIAYKGSIQYIDAIPPKIKKRYRTAWEISNKDLIEMARDRSVYIDQSHGLNMFMEEATIGKFSAIHMYAWRQGLKTGMYYGHSRPAADGINFALDNDLRQAASEKKAESKRKTKSPVVSEPKRRKVDAALAEPEGEVAILQVREDDSSARVAPFALSEENAVRPAVTLPASLLASVPTLTTQSKVDLEELAQYIGVETGCTSCQ